MRPNRLDGGPPAPAAEASVAASAPAPRPERMAWWQWTLVVAILVGLAAAAKYLHAQRWLEEAVRWVAGLGAWGPLIFILIYAVATVCLVPGSALTLGAGAVFGVARGSIIVSVAATGGATCAFLVGRYFARGAVARRLERYPKFAAIDRAVAAEGWKIVGLTRLSPVFPFTLLNYAFALTRVSLRDYVLASWIGMMPGTVMYVYLGSLATAGVERHSRTALEWTLYGVGLAATIGVTVLMTRLARKALAQRLG